MASSALEMRLGQRFESARRLSVLCRFADTTLNQIKVPALSRAGLQQPVCLRALTTANLDRNSATWGCSRAGGNAMRDSGRYRLAGTLRPWPVGCWVVSAKLRISGGEVRHFTPCHLAYGAD